MSQPALHCRRCHPPSIGAPSCTRAWHMLLPALLCTSAGRGREEGWPARSIGRRPGLSHVRRAMQARDQQQHSSLETRALADGASRRLQAEQQLLAEELTVKDEPSLVSAQAVERAAEVGRRAPPAAPHCNARQGVVILVIHASSVAPAGDQTTRGQLHADRAAAGRRQQPLAATAHPPTTARSPPLPRRCLQRTPPGRWRASTSRRQLLPSRTAPPRSQGLRAGAPAWPAGNRQGGARPPPWSPPLAR